MEVHIERALPREAGENNRRVMLTVQNDPPPPVILFVAAWLSFLHVVREAVVHVAQRLDGRRSLLPAGAGKLLLDIVHDALLLAGGGRAAGRSAAVVSCGPAGTAQTAVGLAVVPRRLELLHAPGRSTAVVPRGAGGAAVPGRLVGRVHYP